MPRGVVHGPGGLNALGVLCLPGVWPRDVHRPGVFVCLGVWSCGGWYARFSRGAPGAVLGTWSGAGVMMSVHVTAGIREVITVVWCAVAKAAGVCRSGLVLVV